MQTTSALHKSIFKLFPACDMEYKAEINGVEYVRDEIEDISTPMELYPASGSIVGRCVCRQIDLTIWQKPGVTIPRAAEIKVSIRLVQKDPAGNVTQTAEWIPKGVYYIDTRASDTFDEQLAIHGYDVLYKARKPYLQEGDTGEWPRPMQTVAEEIAARLGVTIDSRTAINPAYMCDYPNDLTMWEILAYIGAAHGANWITTDAGELYMIPLVPGDPVADIGQEMIDWSSAPAFDPYSRVTIWYDDDAAFTAGDDTGRTLEIDCPWATPAMADNILAAVAGYAYQPFEATEAVLDPAVEVGDGITANGVTSVIGSYDMQYNAMQMSTISAPGKREEDHELGDYEGPVTRELSRKVTLGMSYYGTRITRKEGLVIEKTDGATVSAKAVFNAEELSFYDANNDRVLYFDPVTGTYKFKGELNVSDNFVVDKDGNVTMNGSVTIAGSLKLTGKANWLQTRYSTDKDAEIPGGWSADWDDAWNNASTQVWVIYSYDGGSAWTQPMLAQGTNGTDGKDGEQGPVGPPGSAANVPAWVQAYTTSAAYNTLVTNEWVVTMNLYASKMFGGSIYAANFYADSDANTFVNVKSDGFYLYHTDVKKPKAVLTTNSTGSLVSLILGAGSSETSDLLGRFIVRKGTTSVDLCYYTDTGKTVGFTFNDDGTITVHGTLNVPCTFG